MLCVRCNSHLNSGWQFCPFCGSKKDYKQKESHTSRKTFQQSLEKEFRYPLVAEDFQSLTGQFLDGELLKQFREHPAIAVLNVVERKRRLKAGQNVRKNLGNGKFELDLSTWLNAVYDIEPTKTVSRVWITQGGARYHIDSDCSGIVEGQDYARHKGKETYKVQFIPIRDAAFVLGLTPCLICKPPKYKK